ncbi:hypothetical protein QBC34DRAFT_114608 [Podospora aff. communis PSN243]|uniref:Ribosomal RNA-processing protein 14/surfeit locus protein 6 C-terminal domain-containing protein n=1 Tax=Podospora aff. communis PSN243 TaxID=3040156 RepID=A0AAV9GI67_9PEZI|nr:hypothetical protein QBC34DRAFT_114608 [Podospora aff. communis PSN243]
MGKERARDASGKKIKEAKKSSDDRVKKHKDRESKPKKEKKSKRRDEEFAKEVEATPSAAAEDPKAAEVSAFAAGHVAPMGHLLTSISQAAEDFIALDSGDEKPRAKKVKKEKKPGKEKTATAALESLTIETLIPDDIKHWKLAKIKAKERVRKGKERKAAKEAAKAVAAEEAKKERPLFVLDVGYADKKDEETEASSNSDSSSDDDSDEDSSAGNSPAAAAALAAEEAEIRAKRMPRAERRHLILIARQKYQIMKRLGLDPTVKEPHPEVEEQLQKWIEKRKEAQYQIERRRAERKKKAAAKRLRKLIEGKEKQKEKLKKGKERAEKKAAKEAKAKA